MKRIHIITCFTLVLFFASCKKEEKEKNILKKSKQKVEVKYAKGFKINNLKDYTLLEITQPYPNATRVFYYKLSHYISKNDIIKTPIKRIVVSSTTHIPMLELLHSETSLVGFQNTEYISSVKTRELVHQGKIRELGKKGALNTEVLIDIKPDVVVGFALSSNSKVYNSAEKAGIPVILNGDWLEETPLGQVEWIKFFGVLFQKQEKADSLFSVIEKNYNYAKEIANKAKTKPTILSGAIMSKDIWNLPAGDSFVAQFLVDANTNYLWKKTKGKGSLSLSFESVFEKAKTADFWIAPGYFSSKKQMLASNSKYQEFKSFKTGNVYTFANKKGPTGGVIYYEFAPTRPDLVLKDIIKITHPELLPNYDLTFFEKMQ